MTDRALWDKMPVADLRPGHVIRNNGEECLIFGVSRPYLGMDGSMISVELHPVGNPQSRYVVSTSTRTEVCAREDSAPWERRFLTLTVALRVPPDLDPISSSGFLERVQRGLETEFGKTNVQVLEATQERIG